MKRVLCFLIFLLLPISLCSCSDNTTEVSALKADILAIMEDLSDLKSENEELKAEILSLREQIEILYQQIPDSLVASENSVTNITDHVSDIDSPNYLDSQPLVDNSGNEMSVTDEFSSSSEAVQQVTPAPQEETTPSPTPFAEVPPQVSVSSTVNIIYITASGSKYHYSSNCGSGTYFESTLEEALAKGLTPCKKCAGG